jgi:hypothetical protein
MSTLVYLYRSYSKMKIDRLYSFVGVMINGTVDSSFSLPCQLSMSDPTCDATMHDRLSPMVIPIEWHVSTLTIRLSMTKQSSSMFTVVLICMCTNWARSVPFDLRDIRCDRWITAFIRWEVESSNQRYYMNSHTLINSCRTSNASFSFSSILFLISFRFIVRSMCSMSKSINGDIALHSFDLIYNSPSNLSCRQMGVYTSLLIICSDD